MKILLSLDWNKFLATILIVTCAVLAQTWNSTTPPSVSEGSAVIIAVGAQGILNVPANATITIASNGEVNNEHRDITLNIPGTSKVIWGAKYSHGIQGSSHDYGSIYITGGGELIVDGDAQIIAKGNGDNAISVYNSSVMVKGGLINAIDGSSYAIDATNSTVTVVGGEINAPGQSSGTSGSTILARNSTVIIDDGFINTKDSKGKAIFAINGSTVTINGGEIAGCITADEIIDEVIINGGEVKSESNNSCNSSTIYNGSITINGGIVSNTIRTAIRNYDGNVTINGGEIIGKIEPNNSEVIINGGEIIGEVFARNSIVTVKDGAVDTLHAENNGIIIVKNGVIGMFFASRGGTAIVEDGVVNIIIINNSSVMVKGGYIVGSIGNVGVYTLDINTGIIASNGSTVSVDGGIVNGRIFVSGNSTIVTINGGLVIAQGSTITSVISREYTHNGGMIIGYTVGEHCSETDGLAFLPENAGVRWKFNEGQSGIIYPDGFFALDGVTLKNDCKTPDQEACEASGKVWENANCHENTNQSSSSNGDASSSSSDDSLPIRLTQLAAGKIRAYVIGGSIVLENVPQGAKVQVYNLQGKNVHGIDAIHYVYTGNYEFANSGNPSILKIGVQTGVYIVRVNNQVLRIPVM